MERMAMRASLEDLGSGGGRRRRRRRISDLGSADGTNSLRTLREALGYLRRHSASRHLPSSISTPQFPAHVTFEEHPSSDESELRSVLSREEEWFRENDVTHSVLMKSFYEPLFEPESMDFVMSHICLHWLDASDIADEEGGVSNWKRLPRDDDGSLGADDDADDDESSLNFTMMNEATAPSRLREAWRTKLANVHLAKFLALRSAELRPGAEMLLVMVGYPNGFVVPPRASDGTSRGDEEAECCPLTRAMRRCVRRGTVREEVLRRTLVPYYCRTADDVREAFDLAATIDIDIDADAGIEGEAPQPVFNPGALLELVDVRSYPVAVGGGADSVDGLFELFRAIHLSAVKAAGPTEEELEHIESEARQVFEETYDAQEGAEVHYVACVARRRTRPRWSAK